VAGPQDGVLILSEFAGAAAQLQYDAIPVNPYHVEAIADAIHHAWTMHAEKRGLSMQRLRRTTLRTMFSGGWMPFSMLDRQPSTTIACG